MVLYRKYRPQKISELDSLEVKERLAKILSSSYLPHAFLFAGPKGTGKTSAARIVAKALNCEKIIEKKQKIHKDFEPCNLCATCIAVSEGRHLDVIEIDAASNRGIEEIRDLRDKIKLAPSSAKVKIYIIDEVHMLTNEAFNALLKTLEEPPSHAVFILATTEMEKLPETIVSRCSFIRFNKATVSEIISCLKRVVAGEKIAIDEDYLQLIAESSDGSFRDATKILEQVVSENIKDKDGLLRILGRDTDRAKKFLQVLAKKEIKLILSEIENFVKEGVNVRFLVADMLEYLHKMLVANYGLSTISKEEAAMFDKKELLVLIKLFSRVFAELKNNNMPYLPLEVAVVEWCEKPA
jgi:DNA polymerase-3 subunit gamma/tau